MVAFTGYFYHLPGLKFPIVLTNSAHSILSNLATSD